MQLLGAHNFWIVGNSIAHYTLSRRGLSPQLIPC